MSGAPTPLDVLSCPHCKASKPELQQYSNGPGDAGIWYVVACQSCGSTAGSARTEAGAVAEWNRRAQIERMTPSPELLAAVREASAAGRLFAEHNGEVAFINRGEAEDRYVEHEALSCPYCGGSGHKDDARAPAGWKLVPIEPTPEMLAPLGVLNGRGTARESLRQAIAAGAAANAQQQEGGAA